MREKIFPTQEMSDAESHHESEHHHQQPGQKVVQLEILPMFIDLGRIEKKLFIAGCGSVSLECGSGSSLHFNGDPDPLFT
jgi:hypothetical protein